VPYSNYLQQATGTWDIVFLLAAGANILAAVLAVAVLKPWRARVIARSDPDRVSQAPSGAIAEMPAAHVASTVARSSPSAGDREVEAAAARADQATVKNLVSRIDALEADQRELRTVLGEMRRALTRV